MRVWSGICAVLSWVGFVFTTFVHGIMLVVLWMPPAFQEALNRRPAENAINAKALPFMLAGLLVFMAGSVLFRYMRKTKWGWFVVMLIGALLLAGVGLYLKVQYPAVISAGGVESGYNSAFKLVWRHMLPLVVAGLQVLAVVFRDVAESRRIRNEVVRSMADVKPRFE